MLADSPAGLNGNLPRPRATGSTVRHMQTTSPRPKSLDSIRPRMLLALLVAGLLPLALIFISSHVLTRRALTESEYGKMQQLTDELGRGITRVMGHAAADLRLLAANPVLTSPFSRPEAFAREIRKIQSFYDLFSDITLYGTNGAALASTAGAAEDIDPEAAWFREVVAGGKGMFMPPDVVSGEPGLHIRAFFPVQREAQEVRCVVGARVSFQHVWSLLDGVKLGRDSYLVLLDEGGRVLWHPERSRILSPFDERVAGNYWQKHRRGIYTSDYGRREVYVATVLGAQETGVGKCWVLLGLRPLAEVVAVIEQERRLLYAIGAVTLGVIYLVGALLSRRLTRSMVHAATAAQRLSEGHMDAGIPEEGPREVRQMAAAFNRMVREVRFHKDRLETLIEQRTVRLRQSGQQLEELTAHLRAAYESMMEGILMLEWPSGKVIAANQRFAGFFDLNPELLLGRTCGEISDAILDRFIEAPPSPFRWEFYTEHPDEVAVEEWEMARPRRMTLSVYTAPAVGLHGTIFARLWMFRDMTQQRQLEDELRQAQKMEAVGRLAGGIAHDFNNLLTGILGNLSMADMEVAPGSEAAKFLDLAKQAGRRASTLVTQLLGFSRRSRLQLKPCDVNAVLREVDGLLHHSVDPRVEIRLEPADDLWRVSADATQLQQVLMNLCVNAIDAMPEGGRLTLSSQNVQVDRDTAKQWMEAREGHYVRISVADMGHGMTLEVQNHLFEPFFTTKAPGKGTGLGLAMSYGIVKQHGGWITCYSELNRGTTFGIYLPRSTGAAEEAPPEEPREAPARGGNERILIVDDEAAVRGVMQSILGRYGYSVLVAGDGEEALELLGQRHEAVDLVLLDLTMPKLSGRDTFKGIRQVAPGIPVIISSGYPIELDQFEKETGLLPEAFVKKPYEAGALARKVREVLDAAKTKT